MTITVGKKVRDFPFHQVEEENDRRHYLVPHPDTGNPDRLISVTTALELLCGDGLLYNAAQRAAEEAFAEMPAMTEAMLTKKCGRSPCSWQIHSQDVTCSECPCGRCKPCVVLFIAEAHERHSKRRAAEGTAVHDVVEHWALTGRIGDYDPVIRPYVAAFKSFIADYGITTDDVIAAEALVINREHGYAGTLDTILRIRAAATPKAADLVRKVHAFNTGERLTQTRAAKAGLTAKVLVDYKSREKPKPAFFTNYALQMAGYRHATVVRAKQDGTELSAKRPDDSLDPDFLLANIDASMIVQLRPDGYDPRLMLTGDGEFRAFLAALDHARWTYEHGPRAISSHTYVLPETLRAREREAEKATEAADPGKSAPTPRTRQTPKATNSAPARNTAARVLGTDPLALATSGPQSADIPF